MATKRVEQPAVQSAGFRQGDLVERHGLTFVVVRVAEAGLYLVPVGAPVPAGECVRVGA